MVKLTQARVDETIALMEGALLDVEQEARLWRNEIADENERSALLDIEKAAHNLGILVGHLGPPP